MVLLFAAQTAGAQTPAQGRAGTVDVEAESVRCWQRISAGAVRFAEPFSLVLTCAAVDNDTTSVIVDQSKLEPAVVQFPPFEVVAGVRGADLHSINRRFFQYTYTLRLMNGEPFGKDAAIPGLQVNYKIQTRTGRGDAVTGRDHIYMLPAASVRVLSLVPEDATDIRDTPAWTFGDIDAQRFRARVLVVAAGTLFAVGGVVLLLTLIRVFRRSRKTSTADLHLASDAAILSGAGRELADARRQAEAAGWTDDAISRALNALRIAGAVATGRPVSQVRAKPGEQPREGQIALRAGLFGRRRVLVSGSATPVTIARELNDLGDGRRRAALEQLQSALAAFTAAGFRSGERFDGSPLTEAASSAADVFKRLAFERRWPMRQFTSVGARLNAVGHQAWSR
jgi:hypothetical protein